MSRVLNTTAVERLDRPANVRISSGNRQPHGLMNHDFQVDKPLLIKGGSYELQSLKPRRSLGSAMKEDADVLSKKAPRTMQLDPMNFSNETCTPKENGQGA
ncbi:hypothetical protein SAPIO_CDS8041 [Scedosporium apiospermum]|uniref:Uncharacterized protein n=1 Tax=Pseudallescheria apiosperma TaxID=563466 RepID=A0A084G0E0_PSEDA|nr:uncharacterized protein SAPIO_CDS8041 [Scedosporium apiospermum]KEZ40802.1 hypothetical protein SAPIO_CDS8041 [Scedosporium apiospermum]